VKYDGCNPTGVKGDFSFKKPVIEKIWPNPTRGEINLSLGNVREEVPIILSVYDCLGRLLYSNSFTVESGLLKLNLKAEGITPNKILFIEVRQGVRSYSLPVYYRH
jgi:hypothetical protein